VHFNLAFRAAFMPRAEGVWIGAFGFWLRHLPGLLQASHTRGVGLFLSTLRMRPTSGVARLSADGTQTAGFGRHHQQRLGFFRKHGGCSGWTNCKNEKYVLFEHTDSHQLRIISHRSPKIALARGKAAVPLPRQLVRSGEGEDGSGPQLVAWMPPTLYDPPVVS